MEKSLAVCARSSAPPSDLSTDPLLSLYWYVTVTYYSDDIHNLRPRQRLQMREEAIKFAKAYAFSASSAHVPLFVHFKLSDLSYDDVLF